MKRFLSGLLAAIIFSTMLLGLSGTTFAADNNATKNTKQSNSRSWKKAYYNYFVKENNSSEPSFEWEGSTYELVYIDNDNVPELWVTGPYWASGCCLVSLKNGSVKMSTFGMSSLKYLKKKNKFILSGGKMGYYYDYVYKLKKGRAVMIDKGEYEGQFSDDGDEFVTTKYSWNGKKVSKKQYQAKLNKRVNPAKSKSLYEGTYKYKKLLKYFKK